MFHEIETVEDNRHQHPPPVGVQRTHDAADQGDHQQSSGQTARPHESADGDEQLSISTAQGPDREEGQRHKRGQAGSNQPLQREDPAP